MHTVTEHKEKSKSVIEVLEFCKDNNLPARLVGRWIWLKFQSKPNAEIRQSLKDFGFRWSHRRQQWAHNCGNPTKPALSYRPWDKYQTVSLDEALSQAVVT